ncbi:MAG TPA: hypothetical protein VHC69_08055 [Polyangiaceae bacterium]|nr:hypothetical protein [Polyangiaceae bacterium]
MFLSDAGASFLRTSAGLLGVIATLTACGSGTESHQQIDALGGGGIAGSTATVASGGSTATPPGASTGGTASGMGGGTVTMSAGGMTLLPMMGGGGIMGVAGVTGFGGTAAGGTTSMGLAGMLAAGGMMPASSGGAAGAAGASGAAGAGGAPTHPDLGEGDGSDVVLMGDSWMSNTLQIEGTGGGLAPSLIAVAKKPYRNYAVQGVMMLMADTFGPAIPTQWDEATAMNPNIKTVVMTGGGNDIIQNPTIQSSCTQGTDACKMLLSQISDALNTLWTKMADGNVQDVVYVQYASDVGSTAQSVRDSMAIPTICTSGRIRCHAVDSTDAVMKQIAADGIHPLQAANDRLAQVVYDLMMSQGMRR